jgi:hypothetical protein
VALSGSEIYRQIAAGTFPSPIPTGKKSVAWSAREIEAHMERCKRNREVGREERRERAHKAIAARHGAEVKRAKRRQQG